MSDNSLFEILSAGAPKLFAREPREPMRKFETDGTAQVLLVGYSADEISEILAAYREHVNLMTEAMLANQGRLDAVRYRPED